MPVRSIENARVDARTIRSVSSLADSLRGVFPFFSSRWSSATLAVLGLVLAACAPADRATQVGAATVTRIVDGDTIDVRLDDGGVERVRLIGIDTPERGAASFWEATRRTAALAPVGARVFVELDVEHRDRYGRLLAYVWQRRPSSRAAGDVRANMVNARVLQAGLATTLTIQPNSRYADVFIELQREARGARRGLWAAERARSA